MGSMPAPPNPSDSMNGSGLPGGMGTSGDVTGGLGSAWATQQLNSAAARPDDEEYKKKSVFGENPLGGAAGSSGGGGGFMP